MIDQEVHLVEEVWLVGTRLTVEQVLIILVVVKITAILLDLVDAELGWVHGFGPQVVGLEVTTNLTVAVAIGILHPRTLDISTLDDVVPSVVRFAVVLLGAGEVGGLLSEVGDQKRDLVPQGLGLCGHAAEDILEVLQRLGPRLGDWLGRVEAVSEFTENLLSLLLKAGGRCGAKQKS